MAVPSVAMIVRDLLAALDARFPFADAGMWDPVGLQIGGVERPAISVAVCHEVTSGVADAVSRDAVDCLVSYHPLLFSATTSFVEGPTPEGISLRLAEGGTSLIVVHTALDVARPGTADALLAELGAETEGTFAPVDDEGGKNIGRIGRFADPIAFDDLVARVAVAVGASVRATIAPQHLIGTVGVVAGSGGGFAGQATGLMDAYVSGDIGHHDANQAVAGGLGVIDAGHVPSERPGVRALYAAVIDVASSAVMLDGDPYPWEG